MTKRIKKTRNKGLAFTFVGRLLGERHEGERALIHWNALQVGEKGIKVETYCSFGRKGTLSHTNVLWVQKKLRPRDDVNHFRNV